MENISGLLYKEEQFFPTWFYFLFYSWVPFIVILFIVEPELLKRSDLILIILLGALLEFFVIALIGKMTILVRWNEMVVKIGFFGIRTLKVKKSEIKDVKVVDGKLWKMYGGWGIKGAFGMIAFVYSAGGGVEIELINSRQGLLKVKLRKVIISSKSPGRLADAIMSIT
ncbi:MAG: hypothetical protein ACK44H_03635 [Candidatus Kryptonium sp.]